MLTALFRRKEGDEASYPLVPTGDPIVARERIGYLLQHVWILTSAECILSLGKTDSGFGQMLGEPVVLIHTDAHRKGEIGAHAHKHRAPASILQVKIILIDPAMFNFQVPLVFVLVSNGHHDPSGFTRFEDDHHFIGLSSLKVGFDEGVTAILLDVVHDLYFPFLGTILYPAMIVTGDAAQQVASYGIDVAACPEKTLGSSAVQE